MSAVIAIAVDDEHTAELVEMIACTFEKAYLLAMQGMELDAMLIDYDIQAAGAGQCEAINNCARSVIKAAVHAVDDRIPYPLAFGYLLQHIAKRIQELHAQQHSECNAK